MRMVDEACNARADAIKFQTFVAKEIATGSAEKADYQKSGKNESQLEMLRRLELSEGDFKTLKRYCGEKGIIFLSTPFDFHSVDLLERIGVAAYKVSSGDLNNYPFLEYLAKKDKPVILSTGMSNMEEIGRAVDIFKDKTEGDVILLQCTSAYPAPFKDVNLRAMETLSRRFKLPVGFSDHTVGIEASIAAVALGACIIEKHFTLDKKMAGPDHKASLEPEELRALVSSARNVESALGSGLKGVAASEVQIRGVARKRIVAKADIAKGEALTIGKVAFKRSGEGLDPGSLQDILGQRLSVAVSKDQPLMKKYFEKKK